MVFSTRRPEVGARIAQHTVAVVGSRVHALTPATSFFVSQAHGNDSSDGSLAHPFRSIGRCARALDTHESTGVSTCEIDPGTYRENVQLNTTGRRVTFRARELPDTSSGSVVLSGLDMLANLNWKHSTTGRCIYRQEPLSRSRFGRFSSAAK